MNKFYLRLCVVYNTLGHVNQNRKTAKGWWYGSTQIMFMWYLSMILNC